MSCFFITGTGTEIGKTHVAAGMIRHWRANGIAARGLKPVASGYQPAGSAASDAGVLLRAMGSMMVNDAAVGKICPWRFADPVSPDMAAARAGKTIPFEELIGFCRAEMADETAPLLIEGVGGAMVPLGPHHTVRDWIAALQIPAILVAGGQLGTISHTLCTMEALRVRRIDVAAIVLNPMAPLPVPIELTRDTIHCHLGAVPEGLRNPPVMVAESAAWREWLDELASRPEAVRPS